MSLPAPRSIGPVGDGAAESDGIGAGCRRPGSRTLVTVPVLPPAAKVSLSAPAPRSTDIAVVERGAEGDGVGAGAAGDAFPTLDDAWRNWCRGRR